MIEMDKVVQLIGSHELSIRADMGNDNYVAESILRDLRKIAGIPLHATIQFDEASGRYRLITSKKAIARLGRRR